MALVRTRIREGLAGLGDELPIIAVGMEGELCHPVGSVVANLTVGLGCAEGFVARTSCARDKLPYPVCRVGHAIRRLGGKSLVGMLMGV